MNGTQVEIQRIQTRLQELGRTRRKTPLHQSEVDSSDRTFEGVPSESSSARESRSGIWRSGQGHGFDPELMGGSFERGTASVDLPQPGRSRLERSASTLNGTSVETRHGSMPQQFSSSVEPDRPSANVFTPAQTFADVSSPLVATPDRSSFRSPASKAPALGLNRNPVISQRALEALDAVATEFWNTPSARTSGESGAATASSPETHAQAFAQSADHPVESTPSPALYSSSPYQTHSLSDAMQQLDVQTQHVNAMAIALEAAMRELGAIAQRVDHQRIVAAAAGQRGPWTTLDCPSICEYRGVAVPHIERNGQGAFVVTARPLVGLDAKRYGSQTVETAAPASRSPLTQPKDSEAPVSGVVSRLIEGIHAFVSPQPTPRPGTKRQGNPQASAAAETASIRSTASNSTAATPKSKPEPSTNISLKSAAAWILGSVVVRMGLDLLLVSFPGLWAPIVALVVTPAAIAIYRTAVDPQSSFLLGRRLLLIMIGLLIGGRL